MKRLITSICILAVIVAGSVISLYVFKNKNTELISIINSAQDLAKQNKTDQAEEELERLDRFWSDYHILTSYFLQNTKLDELATSVSKLKGLLGDDEFFSECDSIKYGVNMLYENEFPYIHSIL